MVTLFSKDILMKALRALACAAVLLAGVAKLSGAALEEGLLAHLPMATDLRDHSTNKVPVTVIVWKTLLPHQGAWRFAG